MFEYQIWFTFSQMERTTQTVNKGLKHLIVLQIRLEDFLLF